MSAGQRNCGLASYVQMESVESKVKMYGADWCWMTVRAKSQLNELGVEYEYINVEKDRHASEWVKQQNGGKEKKPTFEICGDVLSTPSEYELTEKLREKQLI